MTDQDLEEEEEGGRMVRAYAVTGGRTRSGAEDLPLEALVVTTPEGRQCIPSLAFERRAIAELCAEVRSVAEVASLVGVPLGVARVLVSDLAALDLVAVHQVGAPDDRPDIDLLERVLNGIRAL